MSLIFDLGCTSVITRGEEEILIFLQMNKFKAKKVQFQFFCQAIL
jgi:hypothetical protein